MKVLNRQEMLAGLSASIRTQLKEATDIYQHEHQEVLLKPAADGGWSIAQCLERLNTYAAWYHPQMRRALAKSSLRPVPLDYHSSWLGNLFINMMRPVTGGRKYKAI